MAPSGVEAALTAAFAHKSVLGATYGQTVAHAALAAGAYAARMLDKDWLAANEHYAEFEFHPTLQAAPSDENGGFKIKLASVRKRYQWYQSTGMHALESIRPLLHCSANPVCNCYLHSQRTAITLLRATSTAHLVHMLSVEAMPKLSLSAQRSCAQDICIV